MCTFSAGHAARVNYMRDEPGGRRFFVNDLNGPLYILDKQTKTLTTYLDFNGRGATRHKDWGDAIAGGFVYRGELIPALRGKLVFGDITTGRIWYANRADVLAADDGDPKTLAHRCSRSTRTCAGSSNRPTENVTKKRQRYRAWVSCQGLVASMCALPKTTTASSTS